MQALDKPKQWDNILSQVVFAHNQFKNRTTQKSTLEIIYEMNPANVVVLIPVPTAGQIGVEVTDLAANIWNIHKQVHKRIEKNNIFYKEAAD